ncbi:MAG: TolC family protein [Oligoflexus sp.]|nr:TolC family protein [Oligoflexus sp.]
MAKIFLTLALILSLNRSETAYSEGQTETQLNFDSFLDAVEIQHPRRAIDDQDLERSRESSKRAGVLPDPQFNFGRDEVPFQGALQPEREMANKTKDAAQWKVGLSQSIPWPGTLAAEEQIAQSQIKGIEYTNKLYSLTRRIEAADLFLKIIRTGKLLKLQKENFKVVDGIREFTHEKFRQGVGSHHEFLQAHSESGILKINIASLETDLLNLKRHALFFINHPSIANPNDVNFSLEWPESLLKASSSTELKQPDLVRSQIEQQQQLSLSRQNFEYKRSLPSLMASGEVMEEDSGMRMYGAMIGLTLPLFSNIQRSSITNENKVIQLQTEQQLAWQDRRKQLALLQAESRISQIKANLNTIAKDILPPIAEHIEATTVQFSQSKIDIGAIITARRTLLNLQVSEVRIIESLARAKLSLEKINAGMVDDELDQEVPQLFDIGSSMSLSPTTADPMKSANGKSKTKGRDGNAIKDSNKGESESEQNNNNPGMGM